jgi:membrane protein DedA with SNARE-associated domain
MDDLLGEIQRLLNTAPPGGVLLLALLSGFIETIFPPFPSEGVLLLASFAGARRNIEPWQLIVVSALGSFVSLYGLYALGKGPLQKAVRHRLERWIGRAEATVRTFFDRWGYGAVLVSRFLPAIRGPLTFLAGVYHLKPLPVAAALLLGCLIWNSIVILFGYHTGSRWDGTTGGLVWAGLALAGATVILWVLGTLAYRFLSRRRR